MNKCVCERVGMSSFRHVLFYAGRRPGRAASDHCSGCVTGALSSTPCQCMSMQSSPPRAQQLASGQCALANPCETVSRCYGQCNEGILVSPSSRCLAFAKARPLSPSWPLHACIAGRRQRGARCFQGYAVGPIVSHKSPHPVHPMLNKRCASSQS